MKLSHVVPWGRSRDEYIRMFSLNRTDLKKRILGCADGPASFNAQQAEAGYEVVSVDPIYAYDHDEISERIKETCEVVYQEAELTKGNYNWVVFKNPRDLCRARKETMQRFLDDYDKGKAEGRYVDCTFPDVPEVQGSFDLALCSHFLFLYSEQVSRDVHLRTADVLMKMAKETRIFPINDFYGNESVYLRPVMELMKERGYRVSIEEVDYEFRKGMKHMLKIVRE
jgi:hypothetical protein